MLKYIHASVCWEFYEMTVWPTDSDNQNRAGVEFQSQLLII